MIIVNSENISANVILKQKKKQVFFSLEFFTDGRFHTIWSNISDVCIGNSDLVH